MSYNNPEPNQRQEIIGSIAFVVLLSALVYLILCM